MAGPPIYVDLDDVLCETARGFLQLLDREFDRRVAFEEIVDFDLSISFGLDAADLEHFFELAHQPDVLLDLAPIPGALETIRSWVATGEEVAVVTGRPPASEEVSRAWLERHAVSYGSLLFVDKYGRGAGDGAVELASLERCSYRFAVEDSLSTARFLGGERGIPVLLLDRPWNRVDGEEPRGVKRCNDWSELRNEIGATGEGRKR